ncbi:MAG: hypothetical protein K6L60_05510 [Oceanobacter sp.]
MTKANAESILRESGYIGAVDAAGILGIPKGGHVGRWLKKQKVESVSVPTRGKTDVTRTLYLKSDVQSVAHLYNRRGKKDSSTVVLASDSDLTSGERIFLLERTLADVCEQLGICHPFPSPSSKRNSDS